MSTSASSSLSLLVAGVVGIMQNGKCKILLRKIDDKINIKNCGYSAKLQNGDDDDMLHD